MPPTEQRCEYCIKVSLSKDKVTQGLFRFDLGLWSHIFTSRCPLCQLLKDSYVENCQTNLRIEISPDCNPVLVWMKYGGPGGRPAFYIESSLDQYICFATPDDTSSVPFDKSVHSLRPYVEAELDISRVSRWMSECSDRHGDNCALSSASFDTAFPGLQVLRLVDVKRNCLVEVQDCVPYVALSYIWGAVSSFRLTKSNLSQLLIPGTIERIRLPRTIYDAITLCRRLDLQYLWVDALCLLQNDNEDLERGVNVMDRIYERSWLTVVAACGSDANAGLPGVQFGSRRASEPTVEVAPGIRMGLHTSMDQLFTSSAYNSRGWTLQEHLLSRRGLYFLHDKVFFRCSSNEFSESCTDHTLLVTPFASYSSLMPRVASMEAPLKDYSLVLMHYTERALTNQDDALRAMAGIIRRVSDRVKYPFIQGLPTGALDCFIIFLAYNCTLHRRSGFPSYSWCGWRGQIVVLMAKDVNEWLTESWIVWYKRDQSGVSTLVWDPAANESFPAHDASYIGYRHRSAFHSPVPLGFPTTRTAPSNPIPVTLQLPAYPVLQFWTLAVYLKLSKLDVFNGRCRPKGKSGDICGVLTLDGFEAMDISPDEPLEVVLLSPRHDESPIGPGEYYNAMLLEYNGGVAERRGIGFISQDMIKESFPPGPVWKEVVLG
ncbi:hypothetical protein ACHAPT_008385 [Fusarium lateritium]